MLNNLLYDRWEVRELELNLDHLILACAVNLYTILPLLTITFKSHTQPHTHSLKGCFSHYCPLSVSKVSLIHPTIFL